MTDLFIHFVTFINLLIQKALFSIKLYVIFVIANLISNFWFSSRDVKLIQIVYLLVFLYAYSNIYTDTYII